MISLQCCSRRIKCSIELLEEEEYDAEETSSVEESTDTEEDAEEEQIPEQKPQKYVQSESTKKGIKLKK